MLHPSSIDGVGAHVTHTSPWLPESQLELLGNQDQLFLRADQPTTPMHVGIVLTIDAQSLRSQGRLEIERIRNQIDVRLDTQPRYRKRLAYTPLRGLPLWVDDVHFDICYHVKHIALPRPADEASLRNLCGDLMAQRLNPAKPLWEMFVIEGMSGGRVAILAKAHHCLVDGVRGAQLLQLLLDPFQEIEDRLSTWTPTPNPSRRELIQYELATLWSGVTEATTTVRRFLKQPRESAHRAVEIAYEVSEIVRTSMEPAATCSFNEDNSAGRRLDWLTMDLSEVKAIKNRLGGTINDVVLAVVTGALRRCQGEAQSIGRMRDLRVLVPVNRSSEQGLAAGNFIGGLMTSLPVSVANPIQRYQIVRRRQQAAKESRQAAGAEMLLSAGAALFGVGIKLIDRLRPFNLVVSNVPGPQVPLYLAGAPLTGMFPLVPLFTNQGLSVALFSYAGKLCWGFNADASTLSNVGVFAQAIRDSFDELYAASGLEAVTHAVTQPPRKVVRRRPEPIRLPLPGTDGVAEATRALRATRSAERPQRTA